MHLLPHLPPPPPHKTAWCWQTETPATAYQEGVAYPKISLIMPSYNQGAFIEETIRSILLQNYPALELIIMDGGSTDETVEILKKYDAWISYWVSEKDEGQSHAMNKGWRKATGEIIAFINSDDYYALGTLAKVGLHYAQHPDTDFLLGHTRLIKKDGTEIKVKQPCTEFYQLAVLGGRHPMPNNPVGYFYKKNIQEYAGDFDVKDHYAMDYRFLLKAFRKAKNIRVIPEIFGNYRFDDQSKTFNAGDSNQTRLNLQRMAIEEAAPYGEAFTRLLQKSHQLTNTKLRLPRKLGIRKILTPMYNRRLDKIDQQLKKLQETFNRK